MRRFGLKSILILVAVCAVVSALVGYRFQQRPIEWVEYSESALEKQLEKGKVVFLYANADWNVSCKLFESRVLDDVRVKTMLRSHRRELIPMWVEMTNDQSMRVPGVLVSTGVTAGSWVGNQPWFVIGNKGKAVEMVPCVVANNDAVPQFLDVINEAVRNNGKESPEDL